MPPVTRADDHSTEHGSGPPEAEPHRRARRRRARRRRDRCSPAARRVARLVVAALVLPGAVVGWSLATGLTPTELPSREVPLEPPPDRDPAKLTAVVVLGATGAESFDVLAPYELLVASGRFDVATVGPRREPLPLFPGSPRLHAVDLVPHLTYDEVGTWAPDGPDLVVLPYVPDATSPANAPMLRWLRGSEVGGATLLTICGGSWVAADAGLLDDRQATSHRNLFPELARQHPQVRWVEGRRWVEDGPVISSAGITAAVDATLRAVERLAGREAVHRAAAAGGADLALLDDPAIEAPATGTSVRTLNALLRPDRPVLGVAVHDDVGELDLASVLDLHPRTWATTVRAVGVRPGVTTTRHGLHLVPRTHLGEDPTVGALLVPGDPDPPTSARIGSWADARDVEVDRVHADRDVPAIDAALADIARRDSRAAARLVATGIEHLGPLEDLPGRVWPHELALRSLLLALVGPAIVLAVERRRGQRRVEVTP